MEFIASLMKSMPGALAQGMIWGIMAVGVYITYRILDVADLTVDGSLATGGAICVLLTLNGVNIWIALLIAVLAGLIAGFVTGALHTFCGIPPILAGILTQLALPMESPSPQRNGCLCGKPCNRPYMIAIPPSVKRCTPPAFRFARKQICADI